MSKIKQINYNQYLSEKQIKYISLLLVIFGILVRLIQYINNRSLWHDEGAIVLNIVNRSYLELLELLDYNQAAPIGFLWIEKLAVSLLGDNEYALRLFPLICGVIALIVFSRLVHYYTSGIAVPIAIALFACLKYTLAYSTEVKQYSSDLMITLLLYLFLVPIRHEILKRGQIVWLSLLGAIAIWFSHPAVLVLAGLEAVALLTSSSNKQRLSLIVNRLPIYGIWLLNFIAFYILNISKTMSNEELTGSWGRRYPDSVFDIIWLLDALGRFFYRPLGYLGVTEVVAMIAFIAGCVAYYRKNREHLLILLSSTIITLIASYLHKYPFRERLILFLVPFFILIIAEGIAFLLTQFSERNWRTILGMILTLALLIPPLTRASYIMIRPFRFAEIRPMLEYVKSHQQPGEILYTYRCSSPPFIYYSRKYDYEEKDYIKIDLTNISQIQEERFWLIGCQNKNEDDIVSDLNSIGNQVDKFQQPDTFAYLYKKKQIN